MSDWEEFLAAVPWFLAAEETADISRAQSWTRGAIGGLPELSALLDSASLTPLSIGDRDYELLGWGPVGRRRGWLCRPPVDTADGQDLQVHPLHRALSTRWGGIVEHFGDPNSWWNNQNEVLTAAITRIDVAETLSGYACFWQPDGVKVPIPADEYCVVAVEANGNLTLAHHQTGQLLLFAPDHAFKGVTELPECPPYSLLTIDEVPDLATWIEVCARAWSTNAHRT